MNAQEIQKFFTDSLQGAFIATGKKPQYKMIASDNLLILPKVPLLVII